MFPLILVEVKSSTNGCVEIVTKIICLQKVKVSVQRLIRSSSELSTKLRGSSFLLHSHMSV